MGLPKVTIEISGGVMAEVKADFPVEVVLKDHDVNKTETYEVQPEELKEKQGKCEIKRRLTNYCRMQMDPEVAKQRGSCAECRYVDWDFKKGDK